MILLAQGDTLDADAEALVNSVNRVGVMRRGVALQFRNAYPASYKPDATAPTGRRSCRP